MSENGRFPRPPPPCPFLPMPGDRSHACEVSLVPVFGLMVLEAEKSHDMSPARWSTRKASVIQSESKTLRTRHTAVQSQEELVSSLKQTEHTHPSSTFLFHSGPQWIG